MNAICIGRHKILSEHFCSFFEAAGIECVPAVGLQDGIAEVRAGAPDVIICDYDLLQPDLLRDWGQDGKLAGLPIIAVSLTRRPEEARLVGHGPVISFLYLPAAEGEDVKSTLQSASAVASRTRMARERVNEREARL
ncbi:MAG TPA: hypothetical protein VN677_00805 [Gemmatimonadaceae bacterium]|jgi:hypothetical protein|nr:hypothetical protein [Gemmatimonadaceae bacterium]